MGSALLRGVTFLGRNTLVGFVDLIVRHPSLLIIRVRLDQGLLLLSELRVILKQLSVLRLDVPDVLEVTVDEPERKEDTDSDQDTEDSEQNGLHTDRLAERAEENLG